MVECKSISIDMEDSNWSVGIILDSEGKGRIALYWSGKDIPTHQKMLDIDSVNQLKAFFNG